MKDNNKNLNRIKLNKAYIDINYFPFFFKLNYELIKNYGQRYKHIETFRKPNRGK